MQMEGWTEGSRGRCRGKNELKETWEIEREGRRLEDGWIGAEHQRDGRIKEARVRGVGKEIAELSV